MDKHHNIGNEYAKKENPKTSYIQIRCTQAQKANIVRSLNKDEKLSEFMMKAASDELNRRRHKI